MNKYKYSWTIFIVLFVFQSCEKYLEAKPDAKLSVPSSVEDLQAILDNYSVMNRSAIQINNMTDEYYLRATDWEAQNQLDKESYVWDPQTNYYADENDWNNLYKTIFYANTVLDNWEKISGNQTKLNEIEGQHYFLELYAFISWHIYILLHMQA